MYTKDDLEKIVALTFLVKTFNGHVPRWEADLVPLSVLYWYLSLCFGLYLYSYIYQCSFCQVEAELILMTGEEAEKQPAGLGREDPNALEKPT